MFSSGGHQKLHKKIIVYNFFVDADFSKHTEWTWAGRDCAVGLAALVVLGSGGYPLFKSSISFVTEQQI